MNTPAASVPGSNTASTVGTVDKSAKDDAERRDKLPSMNLGLSWYQLMTSDFAAAEVSVDRGLALSPGSLDLKIKLAHALLFQGRIDEAETIYANIRDRGKTW